MTLRDGRKVSMLHVLRDPVWFWQIFGTYEGQPIHFDQWQVAHLHDYSKFRAREKAPQIGFSWLSALEAVWDGILHLDSTSGFVSVDQREASEKVLYAKKAYAELPDVIQDAVPLIKDATDELWFGERDRPSRLLSIPATSALRGRKMSVYLDEVDFYKDVGKDAKRVAMGRVTRGGRVTMGSTCFGVDTELDKTMQASENFSIGRFPYPVAENPEVQESIEIARSELDPEDFDEEYGCVRGGALADTFPPELIRAAIHDGLDLERLDDLDTRAPLVMSYDVGGSRHPSILSVAENIGPHWEQRILKEIRGMSLKDQEALVADQMKTFPNMRLVIDEIGVGLQSAQALEAAFPGRVIRMHAGGKPDGMEAMDRGQMALELRKALESSWLKILSDREQQQQLRRTKVAKGAAGKLLVEQPGSKKRTHYDKFWTLAYMRYAIAAGSGSSIYEKRGILVAGGDSETTATGRKKKLVFT